MIRTIDSFHHDDQGEWVAELSCGHRQHVRHRPPWTERPWVQSEAGRRSHLGGPIECAPCDRAELPDGLRVARTAGPFDETTVPAGLRRDHRVAERTWARLRVIEGSVGISIRTVPPIERSLGAGSIQPIPPDVPHALEIVGPAQVALDFLVPEERPAKQP